MTGKEMNTQFRDRLHKVTNGRPYIFVVMAYKSRFPWFLQVREAVEEELGYACIRAADIVNAGEILLLEIHSLIDQAEFVIAEVSEENANVFYEFGYARGSGKPIVPLIQRGSELECDPPSDLAGYTFIKYSDDAEGYEAFRRDVRLGIRHRGKRELELLREFLLGSNPEPAYILTSPKFPNPKRPPATIRQRPDVRTFSDNIGILGLIRAFGATLGATAEVHLVSAKWSPDELLKKDCNLYFIGSRKVNPKCQTILDELQQGYAEKWRFDPLSGHSDTEADWQVALYEPRRKRPLRHKLTAKGYIKEDYGLIIRGPGLEGRVQMVIAGAHSLGTAAACYAATTPAIIERIKRMLPSDTLSDKESRFWVLVKGKEDPVDQLLDQRDDQLKIWVGLLGQPRTP